MSECGQSAVAEVIQGEDKTLSLIVQRSNLSSFSLSGATEISARFRKADGTVLVKTLTGAGVVIVDAPAGKFSVILTKVDTALLRVGALQSFDVFFDFGAQRTIAQYIQRLTVSASL